MIEAELVRLTERCPQDLASDKVRAERLARCTQCARLADDGTCLSCGCYVLIRASLRKATCPDSRGSKW